MFSPVVPKTSSSMCLILHFELIASVGRDEELYKKELGDKLSLKPTVSVFHFHSLSSSLFRNKISLFPISQNTSSASTTRLTKRIQKPLNWISKIWIVV